MGVFEDFITGAKGTSTSSFSNFVSPQTPTLSSTTMGSGAYLDKNNQIQFPNVAKPNINTDLKISSPSGKPTLEADIFGRAPTAESTQAGKQGLWASLAKDIVSGFSKAVQFIAQPAAQFGASTTVPLGTTYTPQGNFEKWLMGDQPIKPIQEQYAETQKAIAPTYGKVPSVIIAGTAIFGGGGLNLLPVGGEKKLAETLLKESDPSAIAQILRKIGVGEDLILPYAEQFAEAKTADEVLKGMSSLDSLVQATAKTKPIVQGVDALAQEATKYKSAEEFVKANNKPTTAWEIRPTLDFTGKSPVTTVFSEAEAKASVENLKELGFNPSVNIKENVLPTKSQLTDIYNQAVKTAPEAKLGGTVVSDIAKGGKVAQEFRGDKLNLTPELTKGVTQRLTALGLDTRNVRSLADVEKAAQSLGLDTNALIKEVANNRITDKEVVGLRNLINNNAQLIVKLNGELERNPANAQLLNLQIGKAEAQLNAALSKLVKGGTEAGRTVSAFRIMAQNTLEPSFWLTQAQKMLGNRLLTPEIRAGILDLISKGDRQGLSTFISMLRKSSLTEKAITLWKAGLLTSPTTHIANITGNVTMNVLETLKDVPSTGIDILASLFTGKRTTTISAGTISAKVKGLMQGGGKALDYLKTGIYPESILTKYDIPRVVNFNNKILNGYTQGIFRSLGAEDIVFRQASIGESLAKQAEVMAKNEKLAGQAYKTRVGELLQAPTNEMVVNAINESEYATFNNKNVLSNMISGAKRAVSGSPLTEASIELIAPFTKTPTNIAARIADYSPLGFIKAILSQTRVSTRGQKALVEDLGRALTGTSVIGVGAYLASQGMLTGNAPAADAARDQFYAEGKQPNAIKLWGHWLSLNRISPMGNLLTIGANFQEASKTKSGFGLGAQTLSSGIKGLSDQTFLQGISGALGAVNDTTPNQTNTQKYINSTVSSVVPTVIGKIARTVDPKLRLSEGVLQAIQAKIPGLTQGLPVRRDIFGNQVSSGGGRLSLIDPFNTQKAINNPVINEAKKVGVNIGLANQTVSGIKLTDAEYSQYQKVQGKILEKYLTALIKDGNYQNLGANDKEKQFSKSITDVRSQVKDVIFPALMIKRYGLSNDTNPQILTDLIITLGNEQKFKQMKTTQQAKVIKKLLQQ